MKAKNKMVFILTSTMGLAGLGLAQYGDAPISSPSPGMASQPTSSAPGKGAVTSSPEAMTIEGSVESVDMAAKSLQIKQKSGSMTIISVDPNTKIRRNGKTVQLTDLQTGDIVTVKTQ